MVHNLSWLRRRIETGVIVRFVRATGRPILVVTGCGRSGTTFSARFLNAFGLRIGHERLGLSGIASWYLTSRQTSVPLGPSMADLRSLDRIIVHQVRDPKMAIASAQVIGRPGWEFIAKEIPINPKVDSRLRMAMQYYYSWNLMAAELADIRVRVEKFRSEITPALRLLGVECDQRSQELPSKSTNAREHSEVSWGDMEAEDPDLCTKIRLMGKQYGYASMSTDLPMASGYASEKIIIYS